MDDEVIVLSPRVPCPRQTRQGRSICSGSICTQVGLDHYFCGHCRRTFSGRDVDALRIAAERKPERPRRARAQQIEMFG